MSHSAAKIPTSETLEISCLLSNNLHNEYIVATNYFLDKKDCSKPKATSIVDMPGINGSTFLLNFLR